MRYAKTSMVMVILSLVVLWGMQADAGGQGKGPRSKTFAPVPQTGQTGCYALDDSETICDGIGQDGDYQTGVPLPTPRFTINGDGTVSDNLTKLVWLQDSYRFGRPTWQGALDACNSLAADGGALSDGSVEGDWRLPNVRELFSLNHYGFF